MITTLKGAVSDMELDYGYATTSYGAQGGADGGGFLTGSQNESPNAKRSYGKDTLRPVTIKQLIEATQPPHESDYFILDENEMTQVTFVGQIRNISKQTTNITYKLDDGTGIIEVKEWVDAEAIQDPDDPVNTKQKLTDQAYARVYGRLKAFNNKRHVGANIIRPIQDFNEIQYHLLEATAVHLFFTRGSVEQAKGGANGATNGAGAQGQQNGAGSSTMPSHLSQAARKVLQCLDSTPQTNEGLHVQDIAGRTGLEISEAMKAGDDLLNEGLIYTTVNDHTWAILKM